jgi:hypothetical protein
VDGNTHLLIVSPEILLNATPAVLPFVASEAGLIEYGFWKMTSSNNKFDIPDIPPKI